MAHPAIILKELEETMPNASIDHWIFGIIHTSLSGKVDGFKGLLAANKESLIFKSSDGEVDSCLIEISLTEVRDIEAELTGTVNMVLYLNEGDHIEMSYVSRGNPIEFLNFLEARCKMCKKHLLPTEHPEDDLNAENSQAF